MKTIYPGSITVLEKDLQESPDTAITALARRIIQKAKEMDWKNAQTLGVPKEYMIDGMSIKRDKEKPLDFNHKKIIGAPGADTEMQPLQPEEIWNEGRRATNTGLTYTFNDKGFPVNPYMNAGINGRGLLWQFGPNHAVDNGVLMTRPNENGTPTLYAIGIHKKNALPVPTLSGGFAKFKKINNGYVLDEEAFLESKVEEFFEEMISGSVPLLPEYAERVDHDLQAEISSRLAKGGKPIVGAHLEEIKEQIITGLKLQQIHDLDPEFLDRLRIALAEAKECYAGPVINSERNTNNAWIETRLSWIHIDQEIWNKICGDTPRFPYAFEAGDDAAKVCFFPINAELVATADRAHAAMFAFMAASFLLDTQSRGLELQPNIMAQIKSVADFLEPEPEKTAPVPPPQSSITLES